jgi:hypothetical protein
MCQYIEELKKRNYLKNSIGDIAKKFDIKKPELERYYKTEFFKKISQQLNLEELSKINIQSIESLIPNELKNEFKFIKTDLKKIIEKSLYVALNNGFSTNINAIESGVMTANAGDSAEFIFVARAILAGFNCSSVDVRSSRYDAIIDYNSKLLRVQIKGISSGASISFKDRDRGGKGIDHTHETNIGKRITSDDCDIYVAVDKQVGLCYIIPMAWADDLGTDEYKTVNLKKVTQFKENWDIIKEEATK